MVSLKQGEYGLSIKTKLLIITDAFFLLYEDSWFFLSSGFSLVVIFRTVASQRKAEIPTQASETKAGHITSNGDFLWDNYI